MVEETHFIEYATRDWVRGVKRLIPNLNPGDFVYIMKDKAGGYQKRKYKIQEIETVIGDTVDMIIQDVTVIDLGVVAELING